MASISKYGNNKYKISDDELCVKYKIPKSIFYKVVKYGVPAKKVQRSFGESVIERDFLSTLKFNCYPNGDCRKNRDYVSLKFEEDATDNSRPVFLDIHKTIKPIALLATFSLLDSEGNARFPESFAVNFMEERIDNRGFGLGRYVERSTLLKSDVFNGEYLVVQCEMKYEREEDHWSLPYSFRFDTLYIRERNDTLWSVLREKSPFFKKVIKDDIKELHLLSYEDSCALNNLLISIKTNSDPIFNHVNDVFDLYMFADYVLLFEYKQKCSDFLKAHMQHDFVFNVIAMADVYNDKDLKKYAVNYALKYWNSKEIAKHFSIFKENRPDLAQEIIEYKEIEEVPPRIVTTQEKEITIEQIEKELSIKMVVEETEEVTPRNLLTQATEEITPKNLATEEVTLRNILTQPTEVPPRKSLIQATEAEPVRYFEFYQ